MVLVDYRYCVAIVDRKKKKAIGVIFRAFLDFDDFRWWRKIGRKDRLKIDHSDPSDCHPVCGRPTKLDQFDQTISPTFGGHHFASSRSKDRSRRDVSRQWRCCATYSYSTHHYSTPLCSLLELLKTTKIILFIDCSTVVEIFLCFFLKTQDGYCNDR